MSINISKDKSEIFELNIRNKKMVSQQAKCSVCGKAGNSFFDEIPETKFCWKCKEIEQKRKIYSQKNHVLKAFINKYGNYEDENHFLYSKETQIVIGKQVGDVVMKLNEQDIETCKLMFLDYDQLCIE